MIDGADLLREIKYDADALIEILVDNVSIDVWTVVVDGVMADADSATYFVNDSKVAFVGVDVDYFSGVGEDTRRIELVYGRQTWVISFFEEDRIDLQGDPDDFRVEQDARDLLDLMLRINSLAGRAVRLYREGGHDLVESLPIVSVGELG